MALTIDFTWILTAAMLMSGVIIMGKILLNRQDTGGKYRKSLMREQDDYIDTLEKRNRTMKAKVAQMERGPVIEGDISELDSILPDLFQSFEAYAPKWLKPFLGNVETQKFLINYAQKNPDKVKDLLGKMIKKNAKSDNTETPDQSQSV